MAPQKPEQVTRTWTDPDVERTKQCTLCLSSTYPSLVGDYILFISHSNLMMMLIYNCYSTRLSLNKVSLAYKSLCTKNVTSTFVAMVFLLNSSLIGFDKSVGKMVST